MDGEKTLAWDMGMSATGQRLSARQRPETALKNSPNILKFGENTFRVSSDKLLNLNDRCGGGYEDLPKTF